MGHEGSGSLESLRERNRRRVLSALRVAGITSRAELARRTGLSRTTVSSLIGDLVRDGLVAERVDHTAAPGAQGGRPPVLVSLDRRAGAAVGVDFGKSPPARGRRGPRRIPSSPRCGASSTSTTAPTGPGRRRRARRRRARGGRRPPRPRHQRRAWACPGPITPTPAPSARPRSCPAGSASRPRARWSDRLGLPVRVDNDANLGALGRARLGRRARASRTSSTSSSRPASAPGCRRRPPPPSAPAARPARSATRSSTSTGPSAAAATAAAWRPWPRRRGRSSCSAARLGDGPHASRTSSSWPPRATPAAGASSPTPAATSAGRWPSCATCSTPARIIVGGDLGRRRRRAARPAARPMRRYAISTAADDAEVDHGRLGERAEVLGALALVPRTARPSDPRRAPRGGPGVSPHNCPQSLSPAPRGGACFPCVVRSGSSAIAAAALLVRRSPPAAATTTTATARAPAERASTSGRQRRRQERQDRPAAAGVQDRALRVPGPAALRGKMKELCPDCEVIYSNADQDAAKQQQQAEAAMTNGAKVLVLDPVDSASAAADRHARQAAEDPGHLVRPPDHRRAGRLLHLVRQREGRRAAGPRRWSTSSRRTASRGHDRHDQRRADGQQRQAVQAGRAQVFDGSGFKIAKEYDTPDWTPDKAQKEMEQAITALGKDEFVGVYAANDGTAGGAIAAMKSAASTRRRSRSPVRTPSSPPSSGSSPASST